MRACGRADLRLHLRVDTALAEAHTETESLGYANEEAGQRAMARRWLAQIERYAAKRGDLLDLGAGSDI